MENKTPTSAKFLHAPMLNVMFSPLHDMNRRPFYVKAMM
jgi:hypothetical protein